MYRSNAKLLLFGEYLMLDGYLGLALPLRHGQILDHTNAWDTSISLIWYAHDHTVWQEERRPSSWTSLFHRCCAWLDSQWLIPPWHHHLTTTLTYPQMRWLWSSSTFIDLIAQWVWCDPFALYRAVSLWSGYDIACARQKKPLLYDPITTESQTVDLDPSLLAGMYCIPCGHKQSSDKAIAHYRSRFHQGPDHYDRCEFLDGLLYEQTIWWWGQGIVYHDTIIASLINQPPLMQSHPWIGEVGYGKWLWAWWGDCFLILSDYHPDHVRAVCHRAWYDLCLPLQTMLWDGE